MKKSILYVDDEYDICDTLKLALEDDFNMDVAYTYDEALESLKEQKYHLVISDILLGDDNGLELIKQIKQEYPDTAVMACSGGGHSGTVTAGILLDKALEFGAIEIVVKPFRLNTLRDRITQIIYGKNFDN